MHICLISVEIFAWGKYGGFGRATRLIGRELARRGLTVEAVVPRRRGQRPVEQLDGIRVLSFRPTDLFTAARLYRLADADIYYSQEPSLGTYLSLRAMPGRKHVSTFRDTRNALDWRTEFRLPSLNHIQVLANLLYEDNWLVRRAASQMDGLYAAARLLIPKARAKYRLSCDPQFLPTPVWVPEKFNKAATPTVCFVSRFDRRKRPEKFFELVESFPNVRFIAAGRSRDLRWDRYLRNRYGKLSNLELPGFVDQFSSDRLSRIFEQSWILVNTAVRESLPNSFLEAAAHRCAILSSVDPDGFASRFGYHAHEDDFVQGLHVLLENNFWKQQAEKGYTFVREVFALEKAIDQHLEIYQRLIEEGSHKTSRPLR